MRASIVASIFLSVVAASVLTACDRAAELYPDVARKSYYDTWAPPGIFVGETFAAQLRNQFAEIVSFHQSSREFNELSVILSELPRPIPHFGSTTQTSAVPSVTPIDPFPWPTFPAWKFDPPNRITASFFDDDFWVGFEKGVIAFLENTESSSPYPSRISVSDELKAALNSRFQLTKECTGYEEGDMSELAINLAAIPIPCATESGKCWGTYDTPNVISIGKISWVVRHEFVHYLLWRNTGDPDGGHTSSFFESCVE